MSDFTKYDDVLASILVSEKSILGFLSAVFNFLARRTDFYYVPQGTYENMGFPPGMAEELVIKVLRSCDPKTWTAPSQTIVQQDVNDEIMCSTVAQEVEVVTEEDGAEELDNNVENMEKVNINAPDTGSLAGKVPEGCKDRFLEDSEPPVIPVQKNSESYNGAVRDNYSWSQTIMDLDITVRLPPDIKSSKDFRVTINPGDIVIVRRNGDVIIKDTLPYKIKTMDSFWSMSEGKLLIHLEKVQERWWKKFLESEEEIELSKIDCSRPLDELPEDHIAKVRELQWNQEQKLKGLPTSDELKNIEILRKAWNVDGSPFKGKEFDPSVLHQ